MPTGSTCRDCSPVGVSFTAAQSQASPWWPHPSLRLGLDGLSPRAPSGMAEWHNSDLQRDHSSWELDFTGLAADPSH